MSEPDRFDKLAESIIIVEDRYAVLVLDEVMWHYGCFDNADAQSEVALVRRALAESLRKEFGTVADAAKERTSDE